MKRIHLGTYLAVFLFIFSAGRSFAVSIEPGSSYRLMDHLLSLSRPEAPVIFEDMVIFTAPSNLRRVGIAFVDEGLANVHWFRPLVVSRDHQEIFGHRHAQRFEDTGISFFIFRIPEGTVEIKYRMVIDGLWTTDPSNPNIRRDRASGISFSVISVPQIPARPNPLNSPPGVLRVVFRGPPGERVTVGGTFNNWDPFMFALIEGPPGTYSLDIPLPPGRHQYVFFHRGQRFADIYNPNRVFSRDGRVASEVVIR